MPQFSAIGRELFGHRRWIRPATMSAAAQDAVVPVVAAELARLVPAMPLAFVRQVSEAGETFQLSALMSLAPGKNLFVGPAGQWLGTYVPAAIRAYPFRFLRPQADADPILCIDEASGLVTDDAAKGEAFFNADGALSDAMSGVLAFLNDLERNRAATELATAALHQAELIAPWPIVLKTETGETRIDDLFRVDEAALNAVSDERMARLRATGALPLAYGQLFSMAQLSVFQHLSRVQSQLAPKPIGPLPETLDKLFGLADTETIRFD